jgi:hypothetical protein
VPSKAKTSRPSKAEPAGETVQNGGHFTTEVPAVILSLPNEKVFFLSSSLRSKTEAAFRNFETPFLISKTPSLRVKHVASFLKIKISPQTGLCQMVREETKSM